MCIFIQKVGIFLCIYAYFYAYAYCYAYAYSYAYAYFYAYEYFYAIMFFFYTNKLDSYCYLLYNLYRISDDLLISEQ